MCTIIYRSLIIIYELFDGFKAAVYYGYQSDNRTNIEKYSKDALYRGGGRNGLVRWFDVKVVNKQTDFTITYDVDITDSVNLNILGGTSDVDSLLKRFSDNIFKKQYRGYSLNFWSKLQRLHDGEGYWVDGKLSHSGEAKEKDINQWIINNIPY